MAAQKPVIKMIKELILNTKGFWFYFMFAIGQGSHFLGVTSQTHSSSDRSVNLEKASLHGVPLHTKQKGAEEWVTITVFKAPASGFGTLLPYHCQMALW